MVVWESQQDGYSIGIFARRFNSSGVALAAEFQVNGYTTNHQRKPSLAMISNGSFVVAWESYGQDGSQYGIFARRFDSSGTALGAEFQVNSNISGAQTLPAVGVNAEGGFVIAWEDHSSLDGSGYGIFARRFDAAGTAQASEFQVNSHTPDSQRRPSVAVGDLGDFVIAWQGESDQDGAGAGVFARRFNAAGIAQAGEFQVNSYTAGSQQLVDLSIDSEGTLVASWASGSDQDGSSYGVFARRFDSLGDPLAVELQINSYTSSSQGGAAVSTNAAGDFVVAWASYHDGSEAGVFAQRFKALAVLDVDGDGSTAALTDGLLVLRFLFGFTGSTLINGAVGNGCTRCDAGAIAAYIQTLV